MERKHAYSISDYEINQQRTKEIIYDLCESFLTSEQTVKIELGDWKIRDECEQPIHEQAR